MQIEITAASGEVVVLPRPFALDDSTVDVSVPTVALPGRHGLVMVETQGVLGSRDLRISGHLHGLTRQETDALGAEYRALFLRGETLQIKRDVEDDRHIRAMCTRLHYDFFRGRFGAQLAGFDMAFEAHDPYWYADGESTHIANQAGSSGTGIVLNNGTASTWPTITVECVGTSGQTLTSWSITNNTFSGSVAYDSALTLGQSVVLETDYISATRMPGFHNVLRHTNDPFLLASIFLGPGTNNLTFAKTGTATMRVSITYRERWV